MKSFFNLLNTPGGREGEGKRSISETNGDPNAKFLFLLLFRFWPREASLNSMFFVQLVCLAKSNDKYKSLRSVSPYSESWSWEGQLSVVGETLGATVRLLTTGGKDMGQIISFFSKCMNLSLFFFFPLKNPTHKQSFVDSSVPVVRWGRGRQGRVKLWNPCRSRAVL